MKCIKHIAQGLFLLVAFCFLTAAPAEAAGAVPSGAKVVIAPFDYIGKGGSDDELRRQFAMVADVTTAGLLYQAESCEMYALDEDEIAELQARGMGSVAAAKKLARDQGADYLICGNLVQISDDYSGSTVLVYSTITQTFNVEVNLELVDLRTNSLAASVDGRGKGSIKDSYNELLGIVQIMQASKSDNMSSLANGVTHITQKENGMMHAVNVATFKASEDAVNQLLGRTTEKE